MILIASVYDMWVHPVSTVLDKVLDNAYLINKNNPEIDLKGFKLRI